MPEYPIVFRLINDIRCKGIAAKVVIQGRALMVFEEDEWWCHGVEPGGMTAHGTQPALAYAAFKAALCGVLNDLAEDARSFEDFAHSVREFVADADETEAAKWSAAREEIRSGKPVDAPFNEMERVTVEVAASATISRLEHIEAAKEMVALAEAA